MWPRVLRKGIPALITLTLMSTSWPDPARAAGFYAAGFRGGSSRPGYGVVAVGLGYRYYGHPLDDIPTIILTGMASTPNMVLGLTEDIAAAMSVSWRSAVFKPLMACVGERSECVTEFSAT